MSKYNLHDPSLAPPQPGYVLVIDQTRGDASIPDPAAFARMLGEAMTDHPKAPIVIKTHPETQNRLRPGHFPAPPNDPRITILNAPVSPWRLLDGAIAVYTVSSQLGFEAILAGHRPVVFGQPFFAGWGLSTDRAPIPRRSRLLTRNQLFAAAMILAPTWYDPCRDRICAFEEAVDQLEAEVRAFRQDRHGHIATGMRLWKRARLQDFFGREKRLRFVDPPDSAALVAQRKARSLMIWAGKQTDPPLAALNVEDGFVRSRGLGADLVPPLSLIVDDLGIYYDPTRESRLEHLIRTPLPPDARQRAQDLIARLIAARVSKYNLPGALPDLPPPNPQIRRILVPGQVEDDASIRLGAAVINTNLALLTAARRANPDAILIYKPHPDVEAGLRPGAITSADLAALSLATPDVTFIEQRPPKPPRGAADQTAPASAGASPDQALPKPAHKPVDPTQSASAPQSYDPASSVPAHNSSNPTTNNPPGMSSASTPSNPTRASPDPTPPAKAPCSARLILAPHADPVALIDACDEVWTMTSLLGFEALLRGKPVTCLGAPFYAGWGLTTDLGPVPLRRKQAPDGHPLPRPDLRHLAHAALIAYPRYFDPVSRRPCPAEVAVDRLASGTFPRSGLALRLLAKLQGAFASRANLWR